MAFQSYDTVATIPLSYIQVHEWPCDKFKSQFHKLHIGADELVYDRN